MTYPILWMLTLVQIGKHRLQQRNKKSEHNMNLAYQGVFLLFSTL